MSPKKSPQLSQWQFTLLFLVAVGGMVVLLFGDTIGLKIRPDVLLLYGTVLAFVLKSRNDGSEDEEE